MLKFHGKDPKARKAVLQELLQQLQCRGHLPSLAPSTSISMVPRLISLLEDIDDRTHQDWHMLVRETWRLLSLAIDSPADATHGGTAQQKLLQEVIKQQMCPRLAALTCFSAKTTIGKKYNSLGACVVAEVAMSAHRVLKPHFPADARQLAFQMFGSQAMRDCVLSLIKNCGLSRTHPAKSITDMGSVAQWLDEICHDGSLSIDQLMWILGVQVDTVKLQMQMMDSSYEDEGEGAVVCYTHWAVPQLLSTAQAVMQKMSTRAAEPNVKALDAVLSVLPQALSVCHQVLFIRECARAADPAISGSPLHPSHPIARADSVVLANLSSVVQLGMQCLACAASAGRATLKLSQQTVTHLLLLLARGARLAHQADEQLQQLLNIAGVLNLLSHFCHSDDLSKDDMAELVLAGRQLLARLVTHNNTISNCAPTAVLPPRCDPTTPTRSQSHDGHNMAKHTTTPDQKAMPGVQLNRGVVADAPQGSSHGSCSAGGNATPAKAPTNTSSTPTKEFMKPDAQQPLDSSRVFSTLLHLVGAVHNLSLATHRAMRTTHDHCMEPSKLATLLQWHWLPLATALLEQTLQAEASKYSIGTPPTAQCLRDLASIVSLLEMQTLAGTEVLEGSGSPPWKLFWGGSPAGLHLLATLLRYYARVATTAAAAAAMNGGELLQPARHVVTSVDVVVGLAASFVRSLEVWGPLHIKRAAGNTLGRGTVPAAKQQSNPGPTSQMGPAWLNATWGFAALAVWQAAAELMRAAPTTRAGHTTVWRAMADTALSNVAPCAVQLLLRAAEEVLAAEEDMVDTCAGFNVRSKVRGHPQDTHSPTLNRGGLSRLFQEDRDLKRITWLQRLDVAREQLCMVRSATEQPNPPSNSSTRHNPGSAASAPPAIHMCLDRCLLLARSLSALMPTASGTSMIVTTATHQQPTHTVCCTPISPDTPPTPTLKPAPARAPAAEPWTLPWYAHPSSWAYWEAVVHRLPRDQRGCSYPLCVNQDGCTYGQFLSMTTCPRCCLARFCCLQCWEQAEQPSAPHRHTCTLMVDEYGGALPVPGARERVRREA